MGEYAIDANLLIYAADESSPFYARARGFIEERAADASARLCLAWPTIMAFLRITTHPRVFARPLRLHEACRNIDALLALDHVVTLGEAPGFWQTWRDDFSRRDISGALISDAHLAALLRHAGVRLLYTHNVKDFAAFPFIEARSPLVG